MGYVSLVDTITFRKQSYVIIEALTGGKGIVYRNTIKSGKYKATVTTGRLKLNSVPC